MVRSEGFKKILELKKERVLKAVYKICKNRDLPMPHINFDYCPETSTRQLAHYHPDTHTICISEGQLTALDFQDIDAVMAHEISHSLVLDHGPKFQEEEEHSSLAGWEPPSGVVVTVGNSRKIKNKKNKKQRLDKTRCNHPVCRKKTRLVQCKHCGQYYCAKHKKPYEPSDKITTSLEKGGHPCAYYFESLNRKRIVDVNKYLQTLDRLLGKEQKEQLNKEDYTYIDNQKITSVKHQKPAYKSFKSINPEDYLKRNIKKAEEYEEKERASNLKKGVIIAVTILIVILLFSFKTGLISFESKKCADNTTYNNCSLDQPYYCSNGELIKNASFCGCADRYKTSGDSCEKIYYCNDGTPYNECSKTKPFFCENGYMNKKASICGCPAGLTADGNLCLLK